jgi:hypothetical protein
MTFLAWLIFVVAALLEVGGDAVIRRGLRGGGLLFILAGFVVLGSYGLVVNSMEVGFLKVTWRLCRLFRFSQRLVWPLHFQGVSSSLDLVWTLTHYRRWFGHPVRQP